MSLICLCLGSAVLSAVWSESGHKIADSFVKSATTTTSSSSSSTATSFSSSSSTNKGHHQDTTEDESKPVAPTKPLLLGFVYLGLRLQKSWIVPADIVRWCQVGGTPFPSFPLPHTLSLPLIGPTLIQLSLTTAVLRQSDSSLPSQQPLYQLTHSSHSSSPTSLVVITLCIFSFVSPESCLTLTYGVTFRKNCGCVLVPIF